MEITVVDLGHLGYEPCVELQRTLLDQVVAGTKPNTLHFVEHDPVLTLGASFHEENLLLSTDEYRRRGIQVVRSDRGGDVTYHGPGQLVVYPIFNVSELEKDLHRWLRGLEETMIVTLRSFGIESCRRAINTGVWVGDNKIAAIGIKIRKWVSMHGVALNCNTDLAPYGTIVPCGIRGHGVTSISKELGRDVTIDEAKPVVVNAFRTVFGAEGLK
ncbi:MAG: lipoyl(octanoyl) transferase LipB [Fimbriimonas sp.]|nr:lipoyl(octanoyl) transferase LipB [Fimbriimonas sp.]